VNKITQTDTSSIDVRNRLPQLWREEVPDSDDFTLIFALVESPPKPYPSQAGLTLSWPTRARNVLISGDSAEVRAWIPPAILSIYTYSPQPQEWVAASRARIAELAALPAGWHGPRSEPPSGLAVSRSHLALNPMQVQGIAPDRIVAESSGGIVFYFFAATAPNPDAQARFASLACQGDGAVMLMLSDRGEPTSHVEEVSVEGEGLPAAVAKIRQFIGD
jgi:hypothetical protein